MKEVRAELWAKGCSILCHLVKLHYLGVSVFQGKKVGIRGFLALFYFIYFFIPLTPTAETHRTCPKRFGLMFSSPLPEPHPNLFSGCHCHCMYHSGNPGRKHEKCICRHVQTRLAWLLLSDMKRKQSLWLIWWNGLRPFQFKMVQNRNLH